MPHINTSQAPIVQTNTKHTIAISHHVIQSTHPQRRISENNESSRLHAPLIPNHGNYKTLETN